MPDFRICAALINVYFRTFESNQDMDEEIGTWMLNRLETPNELAPIVYSFGFQKKISEFTQLVNFNVLPQLGHLDLLWIALGGYQIRQAQSCAQVHFWAHNSEFAVFECPNKIMKNFFAQIRDNSWQKIEASNGTFEISF